MSYIKELHVKNAKQLSITPIKCDDNLPSSLILVDGPRQIMRMYIRFDDLSPKTRKMIMKDFRNHDIKIEKEAELHVKSLLNHC